MRIAARAATRIVRRESLHPAGWFRSRSGGRRGHQSQRLKKNHRPLRGRPPHELASITLAVLYVHIPTPILQAAVAKRTVDENAFVQDEMLVLKYFAFMSIHGVARSRVCRIRQS